jgi:outer membrane protein TolC
MPRIPRAAALLFLSLLATPLAGQAPALAAPGSPPRVLSLDEALRLALPASEAVGLARQAVARARGEERRARSEFFPQLSASASYTRTLKSQFSRSGSTAPVDTTVKSNCSRFTADPTQPAGTRLDSLETSVECLSRLNPFAAFGSLPFGQKNQYNLGLQASQLLFSGGRVQGQSRAAAANRRSAQIALTAQEAQLTLDITQAYYDAALGDRLVDIARGTLELADSTLAQTRLAREVGSQPEFDLLRAQVTRDNSRPVVIQREADRTIAYLRLKQLLHLPLDGDLRLSDAADDSLLPAVPALDSLVARAADTTTDGRAPVRQAEQSLQAQEGLVSVARAERLPTVSLSSTFSRLGYPADGIPSWSDFVTDWTVGLAVKLPLFTGGRIGGSVGVARANLEDARLRLSQTRNRAAVDTRSALERLRAAEAFWAASQTTVAQADRAYAIAVIRYREAISTLTELADARIALAQARANRATAARDLQTARVRVALIADLPLATATQ